MCVATTISDCGNVRLAPQLLTGGLRTTKDGNDPGEDGRFFELVVEIVHGHMDLSNT